MLDQLQLTNYPFPMSSTLNIAQAKARLSEIVAAAVRGDDIVISRAGKPQVRLVPLASSVDAERERIGAKRRAAFGMFRKEFEGVDLSIERFQNLYPDYERKFDNL